MSEKTSPRMLNGQPQQQQQQHVADKMPKISPVVAKELVLGNWPAVEAPVFSGPIAGGIGGAKWAANSGSAPSGFHSSAPGASVGVCALARPSATHCRNCPAVAGPYSLPSVPRILYMRAFLLVFISTDRAAKVRAYAAFCFGDKIQQCFCHGTGKCFLRFLNCRPQIFPAAE